ncbi:MAG: flagellar basal body rod protein [bacterium]|nr:flagellar basal body rod protein [bacterium]MCP5067362.1 flagellar basal body rod protein [bacterium]
MISSATSAGLAGFEAASKRMEASAHNVANVNTRNFHPVEIQQAVDASERPQAVSTRSPEAQEVDLARESVEQTKALVGGQAALKTLDAELELKGSLLDIKV